MRSIRREEPAARPLPPGTALADGTVLPSPSGSRQSPRVPAPLDTGPSHRHNPPHARRARARPPGIKRTARPKSFDMSFKEYLLQVFTWWNGQTLGTRFFTSRHGVLVGEDEFGNRYYETRWTEIDPSVGPKRRWVVYNGEVDLSRVPPGWRGWLTHTTDVAPSQETYVMKEWERPHVPNMTGTPDAYRPRGSIYSSGQRPAATGDYVPWTPGD